MPEEVNFTFIDETLLDYGIDGAIKIPTEPLITISGEGIKAHGLNKAKKNDVYGLEVVFVEEEMIKLNLIKLN